MRGGRGRSDSNSAMLTRPRWHNTQHFNKITGNDDSRSVKTSMLMNGWWGIYAATHTISQFALIQETGNEHKFKISRD